MFVLNKAKADKRERKGLTSHFMFGRGDVGNTVLAVTWVDIVPGAKQILHHHPEVQVYVIVQGEGMMVVGEEAQHVKSGDLIYIPSNTSHGIENTGEGTLSYVSAATPAFDLVEAYDDGQLIQTNYE